MSVTTQLGSVARLRVLVAHLGESSQPPWWQTSFTTEAGLDFSTYNFTRSHVSAAIAGATLAARKVHDDRIGRKGTRHLFRFDGGLERAVHREILEADQQQLAALIASRDAAIAELERIATQTVDAPEGPIQIGKLGEEESESGAVELAAHYLSAFTSGRQVFPYFANRQ
ncbi:MAG: BrxE family protein [Spirochaetota bacterium]